MDFAIIDRSIHFPKMAKDCAYLRYDNWNDQGFITKFEVMIFDEYALPTRLGEVKIGFKGQPNSKSTYKKIEENGFSLLGEEIFSLGTSVDYYKALSQIASKKSRNEYLAGLNDLVFNPELLDRFIGEPVLSKSLMRDVSMSSLREQFPRVLSGGTILTDYSFRFKRTNDSRFTDLDLIFAVKAESTPPTNVHALIGRNGIGKTTILNGIVEAIRNGHNGSGKILQTISSDLDDPIIKDDYFSSVVLVSFSAFDPFDPPPEQVDPANGTCFYYIGLKSNIENGIKLKNREALTLEFSKALYTCIHDTGKKTRWLKALNTLQSDKNFFDLQFPAPPTPYNNIDIHEAENIFSSLSSGHAIVLLTITKLIERVEEKTLVLLDEPESHLHPPLLSAFVRALSELLSNRNGVSIIATHSPVVLQEIPKVCAWKIERFRSAVKSVRPNLETFGENVGVITRDIFGLEVKSSGFHTLLESHVDKGGSYEEIMQRFNKQLGFEAQAMLRVLIQQRDGSIKK